MKVTTPWQTGLKWLILATFLAAFYIMSIT